MTRAQAIALATVGALFVLGSAGGQPSAHFTWDQLTRTGTGLDNTPDSAAKANLRKLARYVLEPIYEAFGDVSVNSAYRSKEVNAAVGGATNSDHMLGLAADIKIAGYTHEDIAAWLKLSDLPVGQVIVEHHTGHLHISYGTEREFKETYDGKTYSDWA